jgi:hypothetical protein
MHIPYEIRARILDMACKKRSNNRESSHIVVVISTDRTASTCENEVTKWLLSRLDQTRLLNWRIVVGVEHEDWKDEDYGDDGDVTGNVCIRNTLVFAIYLKNDINYCYVSFQDNLMQDEIPDTISADAILQNLHEEPDCVTRIGVSAIGKDRFVAVWDEIISTEADNFDVPGKGYMQHPMWMHLGDDGWNDVREQSYNFGWNRSVLE